MRPGGNGHRKAGACWLAKDPKKISLLDVYRAVDAPKAFSIHGYNEQKNCPVSCQIKTALEHALGKTPKDDGNLPERKSAWLRLCRT